MQWVRNAIPNLSAVILPLSNFLEEVDQRADKRTRLAVARFRVTFLGSGPIEQEAFKNCKNVLAHQVTLARRDVNKRL